MCMKGVPFLRSYVLGLIMRGRTLDPPIDPPHLKHNFKICYYHSFSCTISGFEKECYNASEFFMFVGPTSVFTIFLFVNVYYA